jgi:hypothetical protein
MPRPKPSSCSSSCSSSSSALTRARGLLAPPVAVDLAAASAVEQRPSLVVLLVDDDGLLIAVRDLDLGPGDVPDACTTLVTLSPPRGSAAAVVVSLDPGGGTEPPAAAEHAWHEARRRLEAHDVALLDWLLVAGDDVASVPTRFGEATPW